MSEIATTRLRATNVSYAAATQWLFNFVVSRAVPPMLVNLGVGGFGTYIFFACFCFTMAIFVWFFIPETKGLSLESMNELFGFQETLDTKRADLETASTSDNKATGEITEVEQGQNPAVQKN